MGAETRQEEGRMIRGSRGSEKIMTAIPEVGHLKTELA